MIELGICLIGISAWAHLMSLKYIHSYIGEWVYVAAPFSFLVSVTFIYALVKVIQYIKKAFFS